MSTKEETINLGSGMNVSSIQITINLGQPVGEPKAQSTGTEISADAPPAGTLARQILPDPNDNTKNLVRITFVPDDSELGTTNITQAPDPGEKGKWTEFLGPQNVGLDIDSGITLVRFSTTGDKSGVATWLPDNPNEPTISHMFQEAPHEGGGASPGEFIGCWRGEGWNASGFVNCLGELNVT